MNNGNRQLLLVDAVVWSDAYPVEHPLRDVPAWYARRLGSVPGVQVRSISAEEDVVKAIRNGAYGVIISGSPRDAWTDDPMNEKLMEVIYECKDLSIPFLGICYGHQLLGRALGARVAPHPAGLELGTIPLELTPSGESCPLFAGVGRDFEVLLSHADAVLDLPKDCGLLARGQFTEVQSFHWKNLLFGVQFHPEMDPDILRFLWSAREASWKDRAGFDLKARLGDLRPTLKAAGILNNFAEHYVLKA